MQDRFHRVKKEDVKKTHKEKEIHKVKDETYSDGKVVKTTTKQKFNRKGVKITPAQRELLEQSAKLNDISVHKTILLAEYLFYKNKKTIKRSPFSSLSNSGKKTAISVCFDLEYDMNQRVSDKGYKNFSQYIRDAIEYGVPLISEKLN